MDRNYCFLEDMCYTDTIQRLKKSTGKGEDMGITVEVRNPAEDLGEKIKSSRQKRYLQTAWEIVALILAVISTLLLLEVQTYRHVHVSDSANMAEDGTGSYQQMGEGIIRYSRDGAALLDKNGVEQWNQSYQIQTPMLAVNHDSAVIADRGGNDMYVFDKKGIRGEIHTNYPIERVQIAENGIVGALLKNEMEPVITCYDAAGNKLVEQKAALAGIGYPLSMALSPEGTLMQVSYLCVVDGVQATRVVYYNFSEAYAETSSQQVTEDVYKNTVIPEGYFLDDQTSVLVGNKAFYVYTGKAEPKMSKTVEIGANVSATTHEDGQIGLLLKREEGEGYELRVYDTSGTIKISKGVEGEYADMKMAKGDVILYEGQRCRIYSQWGVLKFDGEIDETIYEVIPQMGINRYLFVNTSGIEEVRLVK